MPCPVSRATRTQRSEDGIPGKVDQADDNDGRDDQQGKKATETRHGRQERWELRKEAEKERVHSVLLRRVDERRIGCGKEGTGLCLDPFDVRVDLLPCRCHDGGEDGRAAYACWREKGGK